ncbi:MAG: type II toxin-antitoxin system VapC family toxin [Euryarchaeota archaeon]|nr:type II toxin-antitoxin system VapC family toxin [Euryarchaeota archaeon]
MKANGRLAVDTNAVIAYRAGITTVCNLIDRTDIIFLPAVVLGELMYGAINSTKTEENEKHITIFSNNSVIIPIDEAVALRYARVRSDLKKMGRPIPENDIWIAAICMELNVPLMSSDGHFDNIRDLKVVNWTK